MIVISDTSPITNLSAIGQLDLLRQLFGKVVVGPAVLHELKRDGGHPGSEIEELDWVEVHSASNQELVHQLEGEIDPGEAETIAIAVELSADWILIDEKTGRAVAEQQGLSVIGLVGILIRAKAVGLIPAVKPIMDQLIDNGFFVSRKLLKQVLRQLGE